jgi:hypothetical protein
MRREEENKRYEVSARLTHKNPDTPGSSLGSSVMVSFKLTITRFVALMPSSSI